MARLGRAFPIKPHVGLSSLPLTPVVIESGAQVDIVGFPYPVSPDQIIVYGSANMPEIDGATVGGAVDFTKKVGFYNMATTMALDIVSSSSDDTNVNIQVSGRAVAGNVVTSPIATLNGTTVVSSAFGGQQFERLLAGVITGGAIAGLSNPLGTPAVGDVAAMGHVRLISGHSAQVGSTNKTGITPPTFKLQAGDGATVGAAIYGGVELIIRITGGVGVNQLRSIVVSYAPTDYGIDVVAINRNWDVLPDATSTYDIAYGFLFEIQPNHVLSVARLFGSAQGDPTGGSSRSFYEKVFFVNTNLTNAYLNAMIEVLSETGVLPIGVTLDLALCSALNDNQTSPNRQTLPTNQGGGPLTFVPQPALIGVTTGSLRNGNSAAVAEGGWLRLTLPPGVSAYEGVANLTVLGDTI